LSYRVQTVFSDGLTFDEIIDTRIVFRDRLANSGIKFSDGQKQVLELWPKGSLQKVVSILASNMENDMPKALVELGKIDERTSRYLQRLYERVNNGIPDPLGVSPLPVLPEGPRLAPGIERIIDPNIRLETDAWLAKHPFDAVRNWKDSFALRENYRLLH